jgi:LysR family transcriptional regulator for bpeEF and oprC
MDQLTCMRTFARVAELSSFTKAADALELSRAVVSTQIADLEKHLGVRLFHRTTRRVTLTPDGAEYFDRSRRILADVAAADEAVRLAKQRPQGRLRVDVPVAFGRHLLMPALAQFTARYPDLSLEVQYNDRVIDLIQEEVDVAVRSSAVRDPNLIERRVCRTRVLACASPDYLTKHGMPVTLDDLYKHRLVGTLSNSNGKPKAWMFHRGSVRKQLKLPFTVAFNSHEATVSAALRGVGIVQSVDLMVAEALARGKLQIVLPDWSTAGKHMSIVYPAAQRGSIKVRAFADFAAGLLMQMREHVDRILAPAI